MRRALTNEIPIDALPGEMAHRNEIHVSFNKKHRLVRISESIDERR